MHKDKKLGKKEPRKEEGVKRIKERKGRGKRREGGKRENFREKSKEVREGENSWKESMELKEGKKKEEDGKK